MPLRGGLIVESLRKTAVIDGVTLRVQRVARGDVGDPEAGQPVTWTFVEFEADDADGDRLVQQLQDALAPGPWYCDFRSDAETFVVYSGCTFRYTRGRPRCSREGRGARATRGCARSAARLARVARYLAASIDASTPPATRPSRPRPTVSACVVDEPARRTKTSTASGSLCSA